MLHLLNKKYIVILMTKEQLTYNIKKKIRITSKTVSIKISKDDSFPIDINNPSFTKGLKLFYCFDTNTGNQLAFNIKGIPLDSKIIDKILRKHIILDMTSDLNPNNFKMNLLQIIFGAGFGGLLGYIIGVSM